MLPLNLITFLKALERKKKYKSHMHYTSESRNELNEGKETIKNISFMNNFRQKKEKQLSFF